MRLVVDSSSIISLYIGGVLDKLFSLASELYTTDLIADELEEPSAEDLINRGLTILPLTDSELSKAEQIASENPDVSLQDVSVIVLAQRLGATLLADDGPLRDLAKSKTLVVHGSLWVLEQFVAHQLITASQLCETLEKMLQGGRRLPPSAVQQMRRRHGC